MDQRSFSGEVSVEDGIWWLTNGRGFPPPVTGWENGLIAGQRNSALIAAGINTGRVHVTVDVVSARPGSVDIEPWDDVVETSLTDLDDVIVLPAPESNYTKTLTIDSPGPHRIRVYVRGRDTQPDGVSNEPVEEYRLELWPEAVAPDRVYKQTDHLGSTLRASSNPESVPPPAITPQPSTRTLKPEEVDAYFKKRLHPDR